MKLIVSIVLTLY